MTLFRRKRHQLPVSFFAFQDIITALAGTLLIIVLVIAYSKYHSSDSAAPASGGSSSQYTKLQQLISLRKVELSAAEKNLAELRLQRQQLQAESSVRQYNQQLQQAVRQNTAILESQQQKLQNMLSEQQKLQQQLQNLPPELQQFLSLLQEINALEKKLANQLNSMQLAPDNRKNTLVLDCSRRQWQLMDPRHKSSLTLGQGDPTPQSAIQELRNILRKCSPEKYRLLIAVRPSAGFFAQELKDQLRRDFPLWEIIAEPMPADDSGVFQL